MTRLKGAITMTFANKSLLIFGLFLASLGMSYGLWYALFDEHQTLQGMGMLMAQTFAHAAENNLEQSFKAMAELGTLATEYDREVHFHSHLILLSMLMMVLSACIHRVSFSEKVVNVLALALIAGVLTFPLGVFIQSQGFPLLGKILAASGSTIFLAGFFIITLGFFKKEPSAKLG
jgi:hypothetical protein